MRGGGPFLHNDPVDRADDVFGGTTLHSSSKQISQLLLPKIPRKDGDRSPAAWRLGSWNRSTGCFAVASAQPGLQPIDLAQRCSKDMNEESAYGSS